MLGEISGTLLSDWAKGGATDRFTSQELTGIKEDCEKRGLRIADLLTHFNAKSGADLKKSQESMIYDWINSAGKE
jgi:hypothetical protein